MILQYTRTVYLNQREQIIDFESLQIIHQGRTRIFGYLPIQEHCLVFKEQAIVMAA